MNGSNGRPSSLYEQTLECARREIDEASAEIAQMRDRLMGLEARMEAAKAVYEAVAARLNIEDEINEAPPEEVEEQIPEPSTPPLSQEEISRLLHAQKSAQTPNREAPTAPQAPPPQPNPVAQEPIGLPSSESDLIRQHLQARSGAVTAPQALAPQPQAPTPQPQALATQPNPVAQEPIGLPSSESDLIRQHLQARSGAETVPQTPATQPRAPAPAAQEPAGLPSSESDLIRQHLQARAGVETAPQAPATQPQAPAPAAQESSGLPPSESDLIRQHLQAQSGAESASPKASVAEPKPSTPAPAGGLNEEDRMLIEEHLRRRIESESHNT